MKKVIRYLVLYPLLYACKFLDYLGDEVEKLEEELKKEEQK